MKQPSPEEMVEFADAVRKGRNMSIAEFLDSYPSAVEARCFMGKTPLGIVARNGYGTTVELLLERGADINGRDSDGWTALMHAMHIDNKAIAEWLLERGAVLREEDREKVMDCLMMKDLLERQERRELEIEIADFSPALKRDIPAPRPFKFPRSGPKP